MSQESVESEASLVSSSKRRFVYHQTADGESYPDEVGRCIVEYSESILSIS